MKQSLKSRLNKLTKQIKPKQEIEKMKVFPVRPGHEEKDFLRQKKEFEATGGKAQVYIELFQFGAKKMSFKKMLERHNNQQASYGGI